MQNIAPTHKLSRRSRNFLIAAAVVFLLGVAFAVLGVVLHVITVVVPSNPGYDAYDLTRKGIIAIGAGLIFASLVMTLRAITWKTDNVLAKTVGDTLATFLDQRSIYIRNISDRTIGYVDAVLVSHHGVLVLRISDRQGVFFNEKSEWLSQKDKGEWRLMRWNPTREVVADIKKIREYLNDYNLQHVPIFGVVVFTEEPPITQFSVKHPIIPVIHLSDISYSLQDGYFAEDRITKQTAQEVVNLLYN